MASKQQDKNQCAAQAQYRPVYLVSLLKIRPFKGLADRFEDPEEFLDHVQAAVERWHIGQLASGESSAALQTMMICFFRQNLSDGYDDAWCWQIAVPPAIKKDWDQIKQAFREKFGQTGETGEEDDFAIMHMIMSSARGRDNPSSLSFGRPSRCPRGSRPARTRCWQWQ